MSITTEEIIQKVLDETITNDNINNKDEEIESEYSDEYEEEEDEDEEEMESNNQDDEIKEKKKRGRKPKPKVEGELNEEGEKIYKKRGRKPKPKNEEIDEDKCPKKRGRKPKEKVYSVNDTPKSILEKGKNETVILHLAIKNPSEDTKDTPTPYVKRGLNYAAIENTYSVIDGEVKKKEETVEKKVTTNKMVTYKEKIDEEDIENIEKTERNDFEKQQNSDYDLSYSIFDNEEEVQEKEEIINENKKEEIKERVIEDSIIIDGKLDEKMTNKFIKKNVKNIMYEFINSNATNTWPDSTNTHCWWCCHQFEGPPCALPELYRKEKFYVSGIFCCFNCAASYNFSKNYDDMMERYSLLNLMYKKMYGVKFVKIGLAPPRESLKIFGGYLSIEEFRDSCIKMDRSYTVVKPPLVAVIPKIEENITGGLLKNGGRGLGNVNEHILAKTQSNLKLKRNKPITNPNNTLQTFMGIKIS